MNQKHSGKKYQIITFGCRANQFESSVLEKNLIDAGYQKIDYEKSADIVIINTCTVTNRADRQVRQAIRKARRDNPQAIIAASGCLAQLEGNKLAEIDGLNLVIGQSGLRNILEKIECLDHSETKVDVSKPPANFDDFGPAPLQGRTRALLKVQDGCNNACSYCRVRLARGKSRSLEFKRVLKAALELDSYNYPEIVLTGIHLGGYGQDLEGSVDLTKLTIALLNDEGSYRLRLSSIEPTEISEEMLTACSLSERFCHHFHLPLQSGDKNVLQHMNRPYNPDDFLKVIDKIKNIMPGTAIGSDVIVGFPGEDDEAFANTKRLIERSPLAYLHVFPFSARPATKAASLPGRVPSKIITERAEILRKIGQSKREAFLNSKIGTVDNVIIEGRRDLKTGKLIGLTGDYSKVVIDGDDKLVEKCLRVKIVNWSDNKLEGEIF